MKKALALCTAFCLSVFAVPAVTAEETAADPIAAYQNAIDVNYAYELAVELSTDTTLQDNELGFRTSGSDAEHRAAEYIASEMERIGLSDVEMIPVTVDKWQFNGAQLTIEGTDIDIMPVSYMVNGTSEEGITAEIVDCGTGFAADYADKDVAGKIVLVGVDQWNEAWIDEYMRQAYEMGAAAIVSYDLDGYGRWSDEVYQIQDVCCEDLLPSVIVSKSMGDQLIEAIAAGNNMCTLKVDSVMEIGTGVSYDVVGRIPGRSSDQQQIVSGHYDMYFQGFQDDCSAIACAMAIGKGILDSGVQPQNDVLIVAHGAEEWGISGTEFDWTRGAWELINTVHPEWASKTIGMYNFELCAFDDGSDTFGIACVPEYSTLISELVENGTLTVEGREGGINPVSYDTSTMEDGISYRNAGVPYFLNVTDTCAPELRSEGEYGWSQLHYHTDSDDVSTYDETTMRNNISVFGSILLAVDNMAAMPLDLTVSADDLAASFSEAYAEEAGVDTEAWKTANDAMAAAAEAHTAAINELNERYAAAADDEKDAIRAEGITLNQKTLEAFKAIQDELIRIEFSSDVVERHQGYQDNLEIIDGVLEALNNGVLANDEGTGALDLAWNINAASEYAYYLFTPETSDILAMHTDASRGNAQLWGSGKGFVYANTWPATCSLLEKSESGETDFSEEIQVYSDERATQLELLAGELNAEIEGMNRITEIIK